MKLFFENAILRGGPAPVRAYMEELMADRVTPALAAYPYEVGTRLRRLLSGGRLCEA